MIVGPTQVAIVLALCLTGAYAWSLGLLDRARAALTARFVLGVPWGSLLSICLVGGFYLFAQGGLHHWSEPVTLPYRSWSYFSPLGMLTAGFAHGSAGHITGNLLGTVVLAPIVEYAWGQYPPERAENSLSGVSGNAGRREGWLARPVVRALIVFPGAVVVVSVLTSVFALGFSLGFSGTVFAFGGFALVYYPLRTILGMVGISVVSLVYRALTDPVLTATATAGTPGPPSWAGINQQAHIFGLLLGVLLGVFLLRRRDRLPESGHVFAAVLLFTVARGLYALPWTDGDRFFQYRGIGLIVLLVLTVLVTAAVVTSDRRLAGTTTPRLLAIGWLALVGLGAAGAVWAGMAWNASRSGTLVLTAVLAGLFALPALYVVASTLTGRPQVTRRQGAIALLVVCTVVVALPSVLTNLLVLADDPVPGSGGVEVRDYTVTYEEDVAAPRRYATESGDSATNASADESGVIVVSESREIWTVAVSTDQLARQGNASVPLGSLGWRETVRAERTGWSVTGNDSVYVVDLHHDGERTRSFASDAVTAEPHIAGETLTLVPSGDRFEVRVRENGTVRSAAIPATNASTTLGGLRLATEPRDGTDHLIASADGTSVAVAERETE
jgi:membrane associated rhomboid family serine protease